MKNISIGLFILALAMLSSCKSVTTDLTYEDPDMKIIYLHHSTGRNVWYGDVEQNKRINFKADTCMVPRLLGAYNQKTGRKISIEKRAFPSGSPYPWRNYPYDYYNIWVKNGGDKPYMEEPTLEMLTKEYDMVIFKYCFPYSNILEDDGNPDINSEKKTIANYKLQYNALKEKMLEFPDTKFIVWTGAALVEGQTTPDNAKRSVEMSAWVKNDWNDGGDNIYIFDLRELETDGGLFLLPEYANSINDSHPNILVSKVVAKEFVDRIIEVSEI